MSAAGLRAAPRVAGTPGVLRELSLRGNCIGDTQVATLMHAIGTSSTLRTLRYVAREHCLQRVATEPCRGGARAAWTYPTPPRRVVVADSLEHNDVTDFGAQAIALAVAGTASTASLTELRLGNHHMGSRGIRALCVAVSHSSQIRALDLSCGDPAVTRLRPPAHQDLAAHQDSSAPPESGAWFAADGTCASDVPATASSIEDEHKGTEARAELHGHGTDTAERVVRARSARRIYAQQRETTTAAIRARRTVSTAPGRTISHADHAQPNGRDRAGARVSDSRKRVVGAAVGDSSSALRGERDERGEAHVEAGMQVVAEYKEIAALLDSLRLGGWKPARKDQTRYYASNLREETSDCRDGVGRLGFDGVLEMLAYGQLHTLRHVSYGCAHIVHHRLPSPLTQSAFVQIVQRRLVKPAAPASWKRAASKPDSHGARPFLRACAFTIVNGHSSS